MIHKGQLSTNPIIRVADVEPKYVPTVIVMNNAQAEARGSGNRARRRAGLPVADTTAPHGQGMSAGEVARLLRTPNPESEP